MNLFSKLSSSDLVWDLVAFLLLSVLYINKNPLVNSILVKLATVTLFIHLLIKTLGVSVPVIDPDPESESASEEEREIANHFPDQNPDYGATLGARPSMLQTPPQSAIHSFWGSVVGASMEPYQNPTPTRSFSSNFPSLGQGHTYEW